MENNNHIVNAGSINKEKKKQKGRIIAASVITVLAAAILVIVLNLNGILNFFLEKTMGKELPQLNGEPEIGKY